MIPFTPKSSFIAAFSIGSLCLAPAGHGQCQYEITAIIQGPECGVLGFPPTFGSAISEKGEVVGWYTACTIGTDEAFYWSEKTGFVTLDRPAELFAADANDIAEDGTIVGTYQRNDVGSRAFIYKDGQWTELPPVNPKIGWSNALAISPSGEFVVGKRSVVSDAAPYNAYIWTESAGFTDLGLIEDASSWAFDVNDEGLATGIILGLLPTGGNVAIQWDGDQPTILSNPPGTSQAGAAAINSAGVIAGGAEIALDGFDEEVVQPVVWEAGIPVILDGLDGYTHAAALAISDAGLVAGRAHNDLSDQRAILILPDVTQDLNALLRPALEGVLLRAVDINSAGHILVQGENLEGDLVTYVLAPVSESIADLTGDCAIDSSDLAMLLESWGPCAGCVADLDGNGSVGPLDLAELLAHWG
jgi:uncharacterized membrane protein